MVYWIHPDIWPRDMRQSQLWTRRNALRRSKRKERKQFTRGRELIYSRAVESPTQSVVSSCSSLVNSRRMNCKRSAKQESLKNLEDKLSRNMLCPGKLKAPATSSVWMNHQKQAPSLEQTVERCVSTIKNWTLLLVITLAEDRDPCQFCLIRKNTRKRND